MTHSWLYYAWQCIILSLNILNNILEKIMKIWYFENIYRNESNEILYDIIYLFILVEKYGQGKLCQNCIFSNGSSIVGRREYKLLLLSYQWLQRFLIQNLLILTLQVQLLAFSSFSSKFIAT